MRVRGGSRLLLSPFLLLLSPRPFPSAVAAVAASAAVMPASPSAEGADEVVNPETTTIGTTTTAGEEVEEEGPGRGRGRGPADEGSDRLLRWSKKWSDGRINWHQPDVNHVLLKHGGVILPLPRDDAVVAAASCDEPRGADGGGDGEARAPSDEEARRRRGGIRVLVPLCGKTVDLTHFASHDGVAEVVGVDGVSKALEEFASENPTLGLKKVHPTNSSTNDDDDDNGPFDRWEGKNIVLLKGDFFELTPEAAGGTFDAVWDRGSLVAIRPELRSEYLDVTERLMKPGGTILISTVDRREGTEEGREDGPPFSLSGGDVRELYGTTGWVDSVSTIDEFDECGDPRGRERWNAKGLTSVFEVVSVVKAKN